MDKTAREIIVMLLDRLRHIEKTREHDFSTLIAVVRTVRAMDPQIDAFFQAEKLDQDKNPQNLGASLDDLYDGLISLLKNPDPPKEGEQEKLRRLLESFEGPKQ